MSPGLTRLGEGGVSRGSLVKFMEAGCCGVAAQWSSGGSEELEAEWRIIA